MHVFVLGLSGLSGWRAGDKPEEPSGQDSDTGKPVDIDGGGDEVVTGSACVGDWKTMPCTGVGGQAWWCAEGAWMSEKQRAVSDVCSAA